MLVWRPDSSQDSRVAQRLLGCRSREDGAAIYSEYLVESGFFFVKWVGLPLEFSTWVFEPWMDEYFPELLDDYYDQFEGDLSPSSLIQSPNFDLFLFSDQSGIYFQPTEAVSEHGKVKSISLQPTFTSPQSSPSLQPGSITSPHPFSLSSLDQAGTSIQNDQPCFESEKDKPHHFNSSPITCPSFSPPPSLTTSPPQNDSEIDPLASHRRFPHPLSSPTSKYDQIGILTTDRPCFRNGVPREYSLTPPDFPPVYVPVTPPQLHLFPFSNAPPCKSVQPPSPYLSFFTSVTLSITCM